MKLQFSQLVAAIFFVILLPQLHAAPATEFFAQHCTDCHSGDQPDGGLDLTSLKQDLSDSAVATRWVRIVDRIAAGEMPPKDYGEIAPEQRDKFLSDTENWIRATQHKDFSEHGRVRARRLTNRQLERSLHDLLGIDIPLEVRFPAEPRTNGYTTVADGQPMSHFQLEQHLHGIDLALDEAFRRALTKATDDEFRDLDAKGLSRTNPKRRCREPEVIDNFGVVWSCGLMFYGRIPATTAKEDGWYRFTVRAKALKSPEDHGVWCSVRRGRCVSSAPLLAWVSSFEATDEVQEWTFETWLPRGEMLEIRPGDTTLKKARFAGGQVGTGEGEPQNVPGVAIQSIKMEQIHHGPTDEGIRDILFGDLKVNAWNDWRKSQVVSKDPKQDGEQLMLAFAERAFRRPVSKEDLAPYVSFVNDALDRDESFVAAIRGGYRALLCSPRFMYFQEQPGKLDDYALASRLSYFLWNRMPDEKLLELAAQRKLTNDKVLRQQIQRMLNHPHAENFVEDFADQWLDLSLIDFTVPDRRLYPEFDVVVQQSMLAETHAYLQTMLDQNLSVAQLIDSDFTFLNSRLARFYGMNEVRGDALQQVSLTDDSPRGGLLGQGAILKVTANGSTTSPVIRGIWISERLLGREIPPPPTNVPAIEPDIRGAKSIREQLEKHKNVESCAACHKHIDPPGYALENFDPAGNWRETYGVRGRKGAPVDPSYQFADGREFSDIEEFRQCVLEDKESLARNVVHHLLTYGTGAPIAFADREVVDDIVKRSAKEDYGFRTLIEEAVASQIFLNK